MTGFVGYGVRRSPDLEVPSLERITLTSPEGLEAAFVPGAGMVGTSLTLDGVELLGRRDGLPAYLERGATFGIPLLAPWANRLSQELQHAGGTSWAVHPDGAGVHLDDHGQAIHGLLAGAPGWEMEDLSAHADSARLRARLRFGPRLACYSSFPFAHELVVEIEIWGLTLTVRTSLTPTGDQAVPVAFGWHPYVAFPDVPRAEWEVDLPFMRRATLDDRNIPTGEVLDHPVPIGPLGDLFLDDVFVEVPVGSVARVSGGDRAVSFDYVSGYPVAVVFAPLVHDLVCVEPMTAPTDPFSGRFPLRMAEPGETVTAVFDLTAHRLAR